MLNVIEHNKCTGCGACFSSCHYHAITMQYDKEGFEYPIINQEKCVDCGLCKRICPVLNYDYLKRKEYSNEQKGYAARNKNFEQRLISSSGGIFPLIAKRIIDMGGIVFGVSFDEKYDAVLSAVEKIEDISKLQGSKYLQCKADTHIFKQIKDELQSGRNVLFSGLTCQIEGLKSYLHKDYSNFFTIDLICMGIPSPIVWKIYLKTFFGGECIKYVNFKEKSIGWDSFCVHIETDRKVFVERGMKNLYLQSMFHTWNMRPSCFHCPFKKAERLSDFTIADCWGVSRLVPEINDNKGLSSVIVHSHKGMKLWNTIKEEMDQIEVTIDEIAKGNNNLIENKQPEVNRDMFYSLLAKNPKKAFRKFCTNDTDTVYMRIVRRIRRFIRWI